MAALGDAGRGLALDTIHTSKETSAAKLVSEFWQSLFSAARSDMTLVCKDDQRVQCNRSALGAASKFFDCLLNSHWRESGLSEINLPTVDSHVLQGYILEHFKTGETPEAARQDETVVVLEAYELARQYDIQRLEAQLLQELCDRLSIRSAGWLLKRALDIGADDLVTMSLDFLARAWSLGVTGVSISGMCPDALLQYLQSPLPLCDDIPEEHILDAIIEWGKEQLGLGDGMWRGSMTPDDRFELTELISPLLDIVKLERIPAAVLERKIEPLGVLSQQQLIDTYRAQAKLAMQPRSKVHESSFWDTKRLPPSIELLDASTLAFAAPRGHRAARSRLCLTKGKWVWKLQVHRVGRKFAWAGVVDASVDLSFFPGSQAGGFMFGSGGCTRSKAPGFNEVEDYGQYWHKDGCTLTVFLDMDERECSFALDGAAMGVAFRDLPPAVFPAVSLSGGGILSFINIDSARDRK